MKRRVVVYIDVSGLGNEVEKILPMIVMFT